MATELLVDNGLDEDETGYEVKAAAEKEVGGSRIEDDPRAVDISFLTIDDEDNLRVELEAAGQKYTAYQVATDKETWRYIILYD